MKTYLYKKKLFEFQNVQKSMNWNVGDKVRKLKKKNIFEKDKPIYSKSIYEIVEINGVTSKLKNSKNEVLKKKSKT